MDSREDILGRIRRRVRRTADNAPAGVAALDGYLERRAQGPRPALDGDLVQRFIVRSEALASTVERVATLAQVPAACARYLAAQRLPSAAVAWPQLAALDWPGAGIDIEAGGARDEHLVGVTGAFCAVAETGTLMLCSAPDAPSAVSLLPEAHIAILAASRVLPGMEEAWAAVRAARGGAGLPRAVNFISGPSRTGDIEQTIVLGAHGPYRVHIVVVDQA